ncbi:protein lplB [Candidatus Epulonipiscium fishelsonii]|uniref:Protein lplB n=1 Tax=Candidatus Epulonipiscium fishelsonii TaxID=77094 RepID=A0ACC8XC91_9FIRM|nr:protein lplB [Epulopiscium sp. SCG-B11WGA-EpuloA1]ONI43205.1 protein lplB [Epulopiscium sp. SCG-B05WGA-EpuloA1]
MLREIKKYRWMYFLLIPGIIFFFVFKYIPMYGLKIAFLDYNQYAPDKSTFVGFAHFIELFQKDAFLDVLQNTIIISLLKLIIGFPIPIILALMLNEISNLLFKKVSQTLLYLPHFISWVIMAGIIGALLDPTNGAITQWLQALTGEKIMVMTDPDYFVPMLVISDIYKGMGWGTIIYFAAISGVDAELYEAAWIDGAGRFKQVMNITLPSIMPTIVIVFILNCGNILNAGFDQIFMMYSTFVYDVADIIDTYVYRMGIVNSDYAFSTAAGMFKSVVALIMITVVNEVAKKLGNEGLW